MIIVSDTSSISNLLQIGLIDVLYTLFGEITKTPAVESELYGLQTHKEQIKQIDWIKVKKPINQKLISDLLNDLDLGESESIALAVEENARYLIIDEYKGRMIAESYGVKIVGILGILILAKQRGVFPSISGHIDELIKIGFRLDKKLIEKVLRALGEL